MGAQQNQVHKPQRSC